MVIENILKFLDYAKVDYIFNGKYDEKIDGFSSVNNYKEGKFIWIRSIDDIPENFNNTQISLIITNYSTILPSNISGNIIRVKNSRKVFFDCIEKFYPQKKYNYMQKNSYISENVNIGKNTIIGHNCIIEGNITIGDESVIGNNVIIINNVKIGSGCEIQSGVIIGQDGFGFYDNELGNRITQKHYGGVVIENNVFIGSNTVIDRGILDDTYIHQNTKISSLCHIAHNNVIGNNVTIIAGSIILGGCTIGNDTYISKSVIRDKIRIGNNVTIGVGSNVVNNINDNMVVVGNPAKPLDKQNRNTISIEGKNRKKD